ncbi:hypothetical protein PTKIN_Ptkin19aG0057400 [Pterospermum kingtungense]
MDEEDIVDKILDGLDNEYKDLISVIQARDTPITFDELHEKLLTFEAHMQGKKLDQPYLPATANLANRNNTSWRPSPHSSIPNPKGNLTPNSNNH